MFDFWLALLRNTAMLAFVAVAFGLIVPRLRGTWVAACLGLLFGLGACASMLDPIELGQGIFVDSRTPMVVLASFFGGPLAAGLAGGLTIACRLYLGGVGAVAGALSVLIAVAIGLAGYLFITIRVDTIRYGHILLLAIAAPLTSLSLLVLPWEMAVGLIEHSGLSVNIVRVVGVAFLGLILLEEQRRLRAEARVRELAYVDELSGLANRRAFFTHLAKEWVRWERYQETFTIVMIDIDNFKAVNDSFGHPTGDLVIQHLAKIMVEESRTSDVVARTGGEEFGLLLPYTTSKSGYLVAERIRARVEQESIDLEGGEIHFTVSLGVSADVDRYPTMSKCLSGADRALYEAKHLGRNRVVVDCPADQTFPAGDDPPEITAMRDAKIVSLRKGR